MSDHHPVDFLGFDDVGERAFFHAMDLPREEKLRVVSEILRLYCDQSAVLTMKEHARFVAESLRAQTIEEDPSSDIVGEKQEPSLQDRINRVA
ncbi:MAG: hypothetical protein KAT23_00555 [Anaerolineales bacterium]|nr:hypothetical protein [Anaerolineales bacterium]